jgi:hypothetical protein
MSNYPNRDTLAMMTILIAGPIGALWMLKVKLLKLHTYEAMHQRSISIGIITGEKQYFL